MGESVKEIKASEQKLFSALSRLNCYCGGKVRSLFGVQQECLVVDRRVFSLRPDLMLTGRTLLGKSIFKEGEELFHVAPRLKESLKEAKRRAALLRIEMHEVEASREFFSGGWKSSLMDGASAEHSSHVLRELVSEAAAEKGLICLFHEKPFRGVRGSKVQLRWEFQIDGDAQLFSILSSALVRGLHRHESLIEDLVHSIELSGTTFLFHGVNSLGLLIATLQATLAQSLEVLLDELEGRWQEPLQREFFWERNQKKCPEMYRAFLEPAASQIFEDIFTEKQLEDLFTVHIKKCAMTAEKEARVFIDLFRTQILPACLAAQEKLASSLQTMLESSLSSSPRLSDELSSISRLISEALAAVDELERVLKQMEDLGWEAKAKVLFELIEPKRELAREHIDALEQIVENSLWPIPKYPKLLYSALCSGDEA